MFRLNTSSIIFNNNKTKQNNQPMSDEQRAFAAQLMEEIQEAQP